MSLSSVLVMDRRHTHSVTLPGEQPVKYKPQEMLETAYLESNIGVNSQLEHDNNNNTEKVRGRRGLTLMSFSMWRSSLCSQSATSSPST